MDVHQPRRRKGKKKGPYPKHLQKMDAELGKMMNENRSSWIEFEDNTSDSNKQIPGPTTDNRSASAKKILGLDALMNQYDASENTSSEQTEKNDFVTPTGFRLYDTEQLQKSISDAAACKVCGGELVLLENSGKRQGFASCMKWKCQSSTCPLVTEHFTSKKTGRFYDVNRAAVIGFRTIGKGRAGAEKLAASLDIPPPIHPGPWGSHVKQMVGTAAEWGPMRQMLDEEFNRAILKVKRLKAETDGLNIPESDTELETIVLDFGISIDCSWINRNWHSKHGFVTAISTDTGEAVDMEYLCTSCEGCESWKNKDRDSREYLEWFLEHDTVCTLNHEGTAQSMESEGVSRIFQRSLRRRNKARYNPYLSDGDSKGFDRVNTEKPYGSTYCHTKEDCTGHIQKRMGTRLRKLTEKMKGENDQFYYQSLLGLLNVFIQKVGKTKTNK